MIDSKLQNVILTEMIDKLDLPDFIYEKAVNRYKNLGEWFDRDDSSVLNNQPHIYSQGSFCLGTAIRPLNDTDEYDLDLTCVLRSGITCDNYSQQQLQEIVKNELEQYIKARHIENSIEPKHRCLRISYLDDVRFHMDIVPSIPADSNTQRVMMESMIKYGVNESFAHDASESTILITDDRHPKFKSLCDDWKISNPEGYANWFANRMELGTEHILLEKTAKVDNVPYYKRKVPLQRVIQLLKRHRDVMFQNHKDSKPISIIITTLAAHAYNGEVDLVTALMNIIDRIESYVRSQTPRVPNPVDPGEDFADKWHMPKYSHLRLETNFWQWLSQVKMDFKSLLASNDTSFIASLAEQKFSTVVSHQILNEQVKISKLAIEQYKPTEHLISDTPAKPWKNG